MSDFPAPVAPAADVASSRRSRLSELQSIAGAGIALRLAIVAVEVAAFWWWGYAVLLVDLVASLFDVVSSFALIVAIRYAARPPDDDHPFGHGRLEPLAGMQLGVIIALAGAALLARQLLGFSHSEAKGVVVAWAWCVPAAAAIGLELTARAVLRSGIRQDSTALVAEAGHYRVDALTSVIAALGLLAASLLPSHGHYVDLLGATVLAVIMMGLGGRAAWENVQQLIDRTPRDEHFAQVRESALKVPGVLEVEKVRIQHAGPDAHVDIDIEVNPDLPVAAAHRITQHVRAQIQADWPFVREVVVHVEPFYAGDH
jgi:cation diffusion facilitator family transporter